MMSKEENLRMKMAVLTFKKIYKNRYQQRILNCQICHKLPMHFFFNDKYETVILNSIEESYNRLMRDCLILFGETGSLRLSQVPKRIVCIKNYKQLQLFYQKRQSYLENMYIFSWESSNPKTLTKNFSKNLKVHHFILAINEKQPQKVISSQINQIAENRVNYRFPNFSEISKEGNKKMNCERFWMYSVVNGINYKKAFQDFCAFFRYFYENEGEQNKKNMRQIFEELQQQKDNIGANPIKYLTMYTGESRFYIFINVCLRSWTDSRDLGHIRFPFLQLFIAIHMMFTQQRVKEKVDIKTDTIDQSVQQKKEFYQDITTQQIKKYRKNGFVCARGLGMKKQQILSMKQNSFVQLTGLCSFSTNSQQAQVFMKECKVLLKIRTPSIISSINVSHSFAFVTNISHYFYEQEVVFSPLNMFKVKKIILHNNLRSDTQKNFLKNLDSQSENERSQSRPVKDEEIESVIVQQNQISKIQLSKDDSLSKKIDSCQKYTEIQLEYIDGEFSKKKKLESQKLFLSNYDYQNQMFTMNRNQGELLWRNGDLEDALKYFLIQFKTFLIIEKSNIDKKSNEQAFLNDKYLKKFIDPSIVRRLYKQFRQILTGFEWFAMEQENLKLVTNFLVNHPYRNCNMNFFYTANIYLGYLHYERTVIFLQIYFLQMLTMYNRKAAGLYLAATNLTVSLSKLDLYGPSHLFMKNAFQYAKKNKIKLEKNNFSFVAIHIINCHQIGELEQIQEYKPIVKQIIMKQDKQLKNEGSMWLQFIENLGNIKKIDELRSKFQDSFGRPPIFLKMVCNYQLQMSLLRIEQYNLHDPSNHNCKEYEKIKEQLKIAESCIKDFRQKQDQTQYNVLNDLLILNSRVSLNGLDKKKRQQIFKTVQEWIKPNSFNQDTYYRKLRIHIVCLRFLFKMCQQINNFNLQKYLNHLSLLHSFIERKFKNRNYLKMLYLLTVCEFFLACFHAKPLQCYKKIGLDFLDLLTKMSLKMKTIITLDRRQIALMKEKMNKKFN